MRRWRHRGLLLLLAGTLPVGCGGGDTGSNRDQPAASAADPAAPWFEDVSGPAGVDFMWKSGHESRFLMPEIIGGGVALLDIDGDEDLDLYFVQGGQIERALQIPPANEIGNQLFRNDGDWTFVDISEGSGADDRGYGQGVATGDYDNDGDLDLYVTNVGANTLLRNDGNGQFVDVSVTSGTNHPGWGASAAFLDYDEDGWLDLYVTNYVTWSVETEIDCFGSTGQDYCSPKNYAAPARDVLLHNLGNGRFEDVTTKAGIDAKMGNGLGIACADFDDDGWTDIFIANDGMQDMLWHNKGDGTFEEMGLLAGCALDDEGKEKAGMGVTTTDIDNDGDIDLLVCNLSGESDSFFRNEGSYFVDATAMSGLKTATKRFTRFGMAWLDFDNDGWLDLFEANGAVLRDPVDEHSDPYAQENMLLAGSPDGRFSEIKPRGGVAKPIKLTSRAAAFGDLDDDGRIDIVVVNRDAKATVLRNISPGNGHWVTLRLLDANGRDAIGARVTATVGSRRLTRPVLTSYSYLAANDPRVHLGLGTSSRVEQVLVQWVDGSQERYGPFPAGSTRTLRQGEGSP